MKKSTVVAVVEPPTDEDGTWLVSAPAIHYHAQGATKREAVALFEAGLQDAVECAIERGVNLAKVRQPEAIEYEVA